MDDRNVVELFLEVAPCLAYVLKKDDTNVLNEVG
jgi:hypothetical protein